MCIRDRYALNAVAAIRGGLEPHIVEDMYWWRVHDIVEYAVLAAVAYVRASAERREQTLPQFIDELISQLQLPRHPTDASAETSSPQGSRHYSGYRWLTRCARFSARKPPASNPNVAAIAAKSDQAMEAYRPSPASQALRSGHGTCAEASASGRSRSG